MQGSAQMPPQLSLAERVLLQLESNTVGSSSLPAPTVAGAYAEYEVSKKADYYFNIKGWRYSDVAREEEQFDSWFDEIAMVQNSVNSIILLTETDLDKGLTAAFEVQWHRDKVKNLLCAKLFVLHVTEDPPESRSVNEQDSTLLVTQQRGQAPRMLTCRGDEDDSSVQCNDVSSNNSSGSNSLRQQQYISPDSLVSSEPKACQQQPTVLPYSIIDDNSEICIPETPSDDLVDCTGDAYCCRYVDESTRLPFNQAHSAV